MTKFDLEHKMTPLTKVGGLFNTFLYLGNWYLFLGNLTKILFLFSFLYRSVCLNSRKCDSNTFQFFPA